MKELNINDFQITSCEAHEEINGFRYTFVARKKGKGMPYAATVSIETDLNDLPQCIEFFNAYIDERTND